MIHIGTCGFSYDDWREVFYPSGLDKGDFLSFYAGKFKALELNSSYYAIPSPKLVSNLNYHTPDDFRIVVKAFKGITHQRTGEPERNLEKFLVSISPLANSGKLAAVLLQFPFSFRYGDSELVYLDRLLCKMAEVPAVVEFRHTSWMKRRVFDLLQSHVAAICCVDEPRLPGLMPPETLCTSALLGYIRFHGRNSAKWWKHDESWERYDYTYSEEELREWLHGIRWLESKTDQTYIFFNNHRSGQAVANARQMSMLLGSTGSPE
jgi:uncharacterized protein YecE (DUF72 family)